MAVVTNIVKLSVCAGCGCVFGLAMEKGRVFEPQVIIDQLLMERFTMIKMFLSAIASGMFTFSLLSMCPPTQQYFRTSYNKYITGLLADKGYLSSGVGGAILGVGMALCGSCPGMVYVQVGTGTQHAWITVLGSLSGAALYGIFEPFFTRITRPNKPLSFSTLSQLMGGPYFTLALPMASVLAIFVFGAELIAPWKTELIRPNLSYSKTVWEMQAWAPYISGMLVGVVQIPISIVTGHSVGSSSSFCTVVSQIFKGPLGEVSSYLNDYKSGYRRWWQVFFMGGAAVGGYLSSRASGTLGVTSGVSPLMAYTGGALMLIGSRIAAGCTSGHGLSGLGFLHVLSFTAVSAMFGSGIATAAIMRRYGVL
ncbi:unnamed protein product [Owenia fusiformis]|uniref:Sulphur transport domain-containing protein n=1 Tax=Owenia fusiformis TaxID=6347 RepID=A0A8S4PDU7_OWEFU|nr:unnamed protein product [Owenia fusiformis]